MHNNYSQHLHEAFHLQSPLRTLGKSSSQHPYEEGNIVICVLQIGKLKETSPPRAQLEGALT